MEVSVNWVELPSQASVFVKFAIGKILIVIGPEKVFVHPLVLVIIRVTVKGPPAEN